MTSHQHAPNPFRDPLISKAGRKRRNSDELPPGIGAYVPLWQERPYQAPRSSTNPLGPPYWYQIWKATFAKPRRWRPRELLGMPLMLAIIWMIVLWWGEEKVFQSSVEHCAWDRWENWPARSTPHHVVLVADPQLVDPHTYPGRPWPLSMLTVQYTDIYIRKAFQQIQSILSPDSVFFLGDLFDGGREWSTGIAEAEDGNSQDERWKKYDTRFWLEEYGRFSRIFFDPWLRGGGKGWQVQKSRRKLIAGLPGNHDLGFGKGIRQSVRKRFQAYFGNGNRIDIVGNHTFVSLDTVSLSAKGQIDPATGSQGVGEGGYNVQDIWAPVEQFLHTVKLEKARALGRDLRLRRGLPETELQDHTVLELDDPRAHTIPIEPEIATGVPSVVLTHVPLYRDPGTPCGPLREHFPPSKPDAEKDDANSIHVRAGVQYQNVLTPEVSNEIVDLVGDVSYVVSGDDHDYCDVIHHGYTSKNGGIREITVKSISWAMGVRKPGVVLLSLWNPIDRDGRPISTWDTSIQSHLCLLPDQLSIFVRYGCLLIFTLLVLLSRAIRIAYSPPSPVSQSNDDLHPHPQPQSPLPKERGPTSASTRARSPQSVLAVRSSAGRPRSISPSTGYGYSLPTELANRCRTDEGVSISGDGLLGGRRWDDFTLEEAPTQKRRGRLFGLYDEFRTSTLQVAFVVLVWYVWLLWIS